MKHILVCSLCGEAATRSHMYVTPCQHTFHLMCMQPLIRDAALRDAAETAVHLSEDTKAVDHDAELLRRDNDRVLADKAKLAEDLKKGHLNTKKLLADALRLVEDAQAADLDAKKLAKNTRLAALDKERLLEDTAFADHPMLQPGHNVPVAFCCPVCAFQLGPV